MTKISAVLFDYGMVLTMPPDPAAWDRLKRIFAAQEAPFHDTYWKFRDDYDRGILNAPSYWAAVAAKLNATLTEAQLRDLIEADIVLWTQPNPPMIEWAAQLQRVGIKTGILSNIGDAMEFGILETFPWLNEFTHHTFSHRLGMAKPETAIFQIAAEGLATPPEEILFIDDRAVNVEAARQAGMHAVRYTDHEKFLLLMHAQGFDALLNGNRCREGARFRFGTV